MDTMLHFQNTGDDRSTPEWLFQTLHEQYKFTIDGAASKHNAKLPDYFDEDSDGLKQRWHKDDRLFINPPYSKVKLWLKKAAESEATSVLLVAARTDTRGWHEFVFRRASWVLFVKGRLKFNGMLTPAPFPSAILGYNCKPPTGRVSELGYLMVNAFGGFFPSCELGADDDLQDG